MSKIVTLRKIRNGLIATSKEREKDSKIVGVRTYLGKDVVAALFPNAWKKLSIFYRNILNSTFWLVDGDLQAEFGEGVTMCWVTPKGSARRRGRWINI